MACFRVFLSVRQDQKALKIIKNSIAQSHALVAALQSEHSMLRYTRQADHRAVLLLLLLPLSLYHSPTPPINTAKKTLSDAVLLSTVEKRGQTRGNDIAVCILS